MENNFNAALDRFRRGELVIVVDEHDRENEGDLIMLAEKATAEKTAFMVRHTTGILCVAITSEHAHQLRLPYMVEQNQDVRKTAFTVSVDLAEGITTGVSAVERTKDNLRPRLCNITCYRFHSPRPYLSTHCT